MNRLRARGGVLADSSPPATGLGAGSRTTAIRYFRPFANSKTSKPQPKTRFVNLMSHYITKPIPTEKPLIDLVKRPWGSFKQYAHNRDCTVSLMTVLPGQRLSLQSHTVAPNCGSCSTTARWCRWAMPPGNIARATKSGFRPTKSTA
jgi:hypothetical protein